MALTLGLENTREEASYHIFGHQRMIWHVLFSPVACSFSEKMRAGKKKPPIQQALCNMDVHCAIQMPRPVSLEWAVVARWSVRIPLLSYARRNDRQVVKPTTLALITVPYLL